MRARPDEEVDPFDLIEPYVRQRLADDPHLRATVLFAEVQASARRAMGGRIRPSPARSATVSSGRIARRAPGRRAGPMSTSSIRRVRRSSGTGSSCRRRRGATKAYVLVGALSYSGKFRCWFSESDDQAHLVVGIHEVLASAGRHGEALAGRSDGHGHQARHERGAAQLRAGREALRGRGRSVSATARQPQGRGREIDRLSDPELVADSPGRDRSPMRRRRWIAGVSRSPISGSADRDEAER